ncbi:hypothetical protein Leryth_016755 [Lithospermum erythrorhizon]|nr:hypothetical protein Leryth_016755 [Lithospermum erythrorhizon]
MANFIEAIMGDIKNNHSFHTHDHPPYSPMIHMAIQELNEKGGSSEESISEFIKRHYDDLPWAHYSLLKHHLGSLSEHGEIILISGFRYSLHFSFKFLQAVSRQIFSTAMSSGSSKSERRIHKIRPGVPSEHRASEFKTGLDSYDGRGRYNEPNVFQLRMKPFRGFEEKKIGEVMYKSNPTDNNEGCARQRSNSGPFQLTFSGLRCGLESASCIDLRGQAGRDRCTDLSPARQPDPKGEENGGMH